MKTTPKPTAGKRETAALARLLQAGQVLSNLAYNIAQPTVTLDETVRESARVCLKRWDDAQREYRESRGTGKVRSK